MQHNGHLDFSRPTYTLEEVTRKLEGYCANHEPCHKEVVQKLRDMRMIPDAIDKIVLLLIEYNFFNEVFFNLSYASAKFRTKK